MKHVSSYPDSRFSIGTQKLMPFASTNSTCNIDEIEQVSSEIALRKRISLTLLLSFVPFITALYFIASVMDVNHAYFIALGSIYGIYYLAYSIWACSSHCPSCGHTMSKKYMFIMPSLTCSHCGHDLKQPHKRNVYSL